MKITIFGTGYVGLVTGACLAEIGHNVLCIDVDVKKIENLENGIIPIYEPGVEEMVERNFKAGRLKFSTDAKKGIDFGDLVMSAVGTPPDENHKADLRFVKAVAKTFGENINSYKVFVNKSTVPVGTGEACKNIIKDEISKRGIDVEFDIASNPEFLREGVALSDFMEPDRIVCGVESEKAKEYLKELYLPFIKKDVHIFFTDIKSAEILKYASNSFLATKISFINEIANFVELVGGNITDISKGMGLDTRIGHRFLSAGIGYGGSCFPKDVSALIETGKEFGYEFKIIQATEDVNKKQKIVVVKKLKKYLFDLKGLKIAIWGIAFKPKTDDIREAPSIDVIEKLLKEEVGTINVYDPVGLDNVKRIFGDKLRYFNNNYDAVIDADALLILTDWDDFKIVDFDRILLQMKGNVVVDGRNIWSRRTMKEKGFIYECIGK
ncbi:MAG: UDP-glucose/GDP-mannose dehydrogenase family protein [Candidatus Gracilibacteria bacterium]|nr:UDP-glucose/GDP-mannose dehydrogenase family protein [Candidatus Gracilibacteria bacterium]